MDIEDAEPEVKLEMPAIVETLVATVVVGKAPEAGKGERRRKQRGKAREGSVYTHC